MKKLVLVFACSGISAVLAMPPAIGVAKSKGEFRVDKARILGNTSLFDGSVVETGPARSELLLKNGSVLLAADTRVRVYADRLILERGIAEAKDSPQFAIEANSLSSRIEGAGRVQVAWNLGSRVRVATTGGAAGVRNSRGLLVARVSTDRAMEFEPQGGAGGAAKVSGVLERVNGHYLLKDQTTNVTVELRGEKLESAVGKFVEITGSTMEETPAGGASSVIQVSELKVVGKAVRGGAGAAGTAPAGMGSGVSTTTIAIVGGVAATGATIGGLYATGVIGGGESPASR